MSWRIVVVSNRAKLDLKLNYLVIRSQEIKKIHLSEISVLMVESTAVSLTASLLCEMNKRKIKVIFCDEKRNPFAELVSCCGSHDSSLKIREQLAWTDECKAMVWTEIVREKISNQRNLLQKCGRFEFRMLDGYLSQLEMRDVTNREGHAAKVYFNALFGMDFSRSEDCQFNSALNYGYSILLSAFNREIVASGFITQLGIFHDNIFNHFNFSSDLMEPFRPIVDETALHMEFDMLSSLEKMQLVSILNKPVLIDRKRQYLNNAIRIYCKSVFDALTHNDVTLLRFWEDEP